ncbi:MAG: UDP-N-acetylglucosamine 2-epimerase (non-hydrolyzing) [Robiginitomaculum sp.]|nr:MAG: UDP-N-acetylglucosamine 2-epimerase (non-hydrolyzing) [Robiginitomaculum sp.]
MPNGTFKIITIVGARPQFIKAASVSRAIAAKGNFEEILIHTGQHYDDNMSDIFFRELEIKTPAYNLAMGGGGHGQMTGRMLEGLEAIYLKEKPDAVLVYGDTNSTLAGALAAVKLHIPIAHVEAGLRSFNRKMPEEINRILSDQLSELLFCPTSESIKNLKDEGMRSGIHHVGDVMHDATLHAIRKIQGSTEVLEKYDIGDVPYAFCTLHRAENTDDPGRFKSLLSFLEEEAKTRKIIFSVHPRTRKLMHAGGLSLTGVQMIDPVGYFELHSLLHHSTLVITDSGGVQKEAYFHRTPCITMRDETEWVETIHSGWNRLWTTPDWTGDRGRITDYGNGDAASKIVEIMHTHFNA